MYRHRTPLGGRNVEYFSEDPYLSGVMGVQIARAIQDHGVIAMAKHHVLDDQETERFRASVEVEDAVMRELYLLPFEMLVKDADIAAVMNGAYNRIRGTYATEHHETLTQILREEWGFEGYVQSDVWSTRSAAPSLNAGLDHEMPDAKWLGEETVRSALSDTSLEIETVDRALVCRDTQMFRLGQVERPYAPGEIDARAHGEISRRIGSQFAVLLKDEDGALPIAPVGRILIVGQAPYARDACQGGGDSSQVDPLYTVLPPKGLRDVLGEMGSVAVVDAVVVERDLANLDAAVAAAREADTVLIMAGIVATEGEDRPDLTLPDDQDRLIAEVLAANPRSIVVLQDSSPVLMPWIDQAPAVLEAWNQGAEDGHVVADLVLGRVTPSGKLPTTYPRREEDTLYAGEPSRLPGVDEGAGYPVIRYSEGRQIGYRWHQAQGIEPLFGFGFGLSYTTFALEDIAVDAPMPGAEPFTVRARVANTGDRDGAEVVQVYLALPGDDQPPRRLVGFAKVAVAAGTSEAVEIVVDPAATLHPMGVWDRGAHAFVIPPGEHVVHVGTSADDTTFEQVITVP